MNTSAKTSDLIPHNGRFTTLNRAADKFEDGFH